MHRTFRIALIALTRNTMRSILTCLGIVIGIAAVIAMVEIGLGSSHAIQQAIARMGANVVQIDPSDAVKAGVSTGGGGRVTLTPADCDAIRRCPGVNWAAPSVDCHVQIVCGNKNYAPRKSWEPPPIIFSSATGEPCRPALRSLMTMSAASHMCAYWGKRRRRRCSATSRRSVRKSVSTMYRSR